MILTALALAVAQPAAPAPPTVRPFEGMHFLLGHCWQGTFADGKIDTHCFEPVYGGALIRDRHEVTGGYAGETLYNWNAPEGRAEYTYWNTSGGVSRGTMRPVGTILDFGDEVYRGRDGREQRIATSWHPDGDTAYEARTTSAADPTNSRVVRYVRADHAPAQIEEGNASDGTRSLSVDITIPAPIAQVYDTFATAAGWRSWAVPSAWDVPGQPDLMETSYAADAQLGNPANIRQQFLARVPNRLLVFRTIQFPPGFANAEVYARITGVVEFEPAGSGTRLRLTGTGYPAGPAGDQLIAFFREGNRTSLEQLRARFVSGPIDWAARRTANQ